MKKQKRVNIIGAGIGGLVCGAYLAKKGYQVKIFEKLHKAGGCVNNFNRKDYHFEASTHQIIAPIYFKMAYKILGIKKKIPIKKSSNLYEFIYTNQNNEVEKYLLPTGISALQAALCNYFPDETAKIKKYFSIIKKISRDVLRIRMLIFTENIFFHLFDAITALMLKQGKDKGIAKKIGIWSYRYMVKYINQTYHELMNTIGFSEKLQSVMSQYCMYLSTHPEQVSAVMMSAVYYLYADQQPFLFKNGSHEFIDDLCNVIIRHNGQIFYKTEIKKIIEKNNQALGIEDSKGQQHFADYTISNISSQITFSQLLNKSMLPDDYKKHLNDIKLSHSTFQTYIGFNESIEKFGFQADTVFLNESTEIGNKNAINCLSTIVMTNYNHLNNNKNNNSIVLIELSNYQDWEKLQYKSDEYKKMKELKQNQLLDRFEKITSIPLKKKADIIFSATPLTNQYYMSNLVGEFIGPNFIIDQSLSKRTDVKTPIDHLFLTGQYVQPGGGVSSVVNGGILTAKTLIANDK